MKRFVTARRALLGAALCTVLVTTACGSNHSNAELQRAAGYSPAPSADTSTAATPTASGDIASPDAPAAAVASSGVASVPAPGSAVGSVSGSAPKTPTGAAAASSKPGASNTAAGSAGSAAQSGSSALAGSPSAPSPGVPGAPQTPAGGGSTIVLGSIGSDSGVLGQILLPVLNGAKAWAADINARGGLNGHPVKVIFGDDAGDPGRALSLAQSMVDQQGAVAFFAERGPGTAQAVNTFLEQRKIPVIGGCGCSVASATSPMSFMVGAGGDLGLAWMHTLPLLSYAPDKQKVSLIYCRESPSCKSGRDHIVNTIAKQAGLQVVHEAQASISAPDYTAEVLSAKNAGAEAIIAFMDNFSVTRLAKSAHRQSWNPPISVQFSFHDERAAKNGGQDVEGFLVGAAMPHWTSPKLTDFQGAMQKYVPGGVLGSWSEMAWGAGKLMEVIAKSFPAKPASADFLKGLYALNGETLGGLVPPLTYREGKGSDLSNLCIVPMKVDGGKFVPKNGDSFECAPGWQPVRK